MFELKGGINHGTENQIGDQGVVSLSTALEKLHLLEELTLSSQLTALPASLTFSPYHGLIHVHSSSLSCSDNTIGGGGLKALARVFSKPSHPLRYFDLSREFRFLIPETHCITNQPITITHSILTFATCLQTSSSMIQASHRSGQPCLNQLT